MKLHLNILPPAQRALWQHLDELPSDFVLYGDTAIALQLGHRESVDFDFFARADFDPQAVLEQCALFQQVQVLNLNKNTLTVRFENAEPVLLSLFGVPKLPQLETPHELDKPKIRLGTLKELAGMKAMVVQKRAEMKDYLDLHALIFQAKLDLLVILSAGKKLYLPHFAPEQTLKAMNYFEDGNLAQLPNSIKQDLRKAVRSVEFRKLDQL